jgi:hypothetical protein
MLGEYSLNTSQCRDQEEGLSFLPEKPHRFNSYLNIASGDTQQRNVR